MDRNIVKKRKIKGITLIALAVTIAILIIISLIVTNIALGKNGLVNTTKRTRIDHTHHSVWEAMDIEYSAFCVDKAKQSGELIEYLQEKQIIGKEKIDAGYVINTEKLLGEKVALGNGTDGKNDVYKLEEETTETTDESKYKVKYYGESGERELGVLANEMETVELEIENEEMHKLKVGDYVQLPYNKGTLECMVIYDDKYNAEKGTDYGIQMITTSAVGDGVTLGFDVDLSADIDSTEIEKQIRIAEEKYNNAIITLNEEASKYVDESNNEYVKSARCVGSVPDNPNEESEDYEELYTEDKKYHIKIKGEDTNGESDERQLEDIANRGLTDSFDEEEFWAASRGCFETSIIDGWGIMSWRYWASSGEWLFMCEDIVMRYLDETPLRGLDMCTHKIRPVFTVNTKSQATLYGSGTKQDPYRWTEDLK